MRMTIGGCRVHVLPCVRYSHALFVSTVCVTFIRKKENEINMHIKKIVEK